MKNYCFVFICLVTSLQAFAQIRSGRSNPINVDYSPIPQEATVAKNLGINSMPRYHALIIGVSEYQFAGPDLPNLEEPVKDAIRLKEVLYKKYFFNEEDITVLTNPTREQIINELDRLINVVTSRDNLLIFYAGHGYYDKNSDLGFWLPSNAKSRSRADWIANSTIKDYVRAINSKHTLLITDACFAGSIFKTRTINTLDPRKFYELYRDKSRKAITSGNLSEVPDKSYFLEYLLRVLEENEQDYLPASSLFARIYEPVLNNSPTVPQFGVIQQAGDEGGDFILIRRKENKEAAGASQK
ncbi:MAG: caspase family protein [Cyclobacteriaceae bacterium]|nr:caspase family protein [Cyclobacteriaceae bacterium]